MQQSSDLRRFRRTTLTADVVVVGAGPAGFSAALAAARSGAHTLLITERSVLGGNHSSEVRVSISGAGHRTWGRFSQETGILDEYLQRMTYRSHFSGGWRWANADCVFFEMADAEPKLTLALNTVVNQVICDRPGHMVAVEGVQMRAETTLVCQASYFIDCTGDGTLGYLAGADYRMGREAQTEFDEPSAPEEADSITMGATLLFSSVQRDGPIPYAPPPGAIDIAALPDLPYFGNCFPRDAKGQYYGFWWAEVGGVIDPIYDDAEVMRECRQLIYGIWDYIKNSGKFENVANLELDWIAPLPGKRESRRLLGPCILTENTYLRQEHFADAVAYCGYMIDVHPPFGYKTPDWGVVANYHPGPADVPLRCLYSRNVENLFFAGRNVSGTHQGIGSLRVAGTCGVTGQAAGNAAAHCVANERPPAQWTGEQVTALQDALMRQDQSILGRRLVEENDRSRTAQVSASSARALAICTGNDWQPLNAQIGVLIPVATPTLDAVSFYLDGPAGTAVRADCFGCDRAENYRLQHHLAHVETTIAGEGWATFRCDVQPGDGQKIFVVLQPAEGIRIRTAETVLAGALGLHIPAHTELGFATKYSWPAQMPWFTVEPPQSVYAASCVNDGHIRPFGVPHMWSSDMMREAHAEWIAYAFPAPQHVRRVELVFNPDLNRDRQHVYRMPSQLVRAYTVEVCTADGWQTVVSETDNILRLRCHDFPAARATGVRLTILETWGTPYAEVYDFRVY